ncbi:MAG: RNA polymerase sigma factor [Blastocatellales bacterium]
MINTKASETITSGLTEASFLRLLRWLDKDFEQAGEKYEMLRQKLNIFFEHRGCNIPDELTDKTLDRVSRKLLQNEMEVLTSDPSAYCYRVAHFILKEYWRDPRRNTQALDIQADSSILIIADTTSAQDERLETERKMIHLNECLQQLSAEDRDLITRYYAGDHRGRITNRQDLANHLGISPGGLRIRALRIRKQLLDCICRCQKLSDDK